MTIGIALFFLGLCMGSFANVLIERLPLDQSIVTPRSRCPRCLHPLHWSDNIPLFSFLWLKARCRYCTAPIRWQYPLIEFTMAVLFSMTASLYSDLVSIAIACILVFYGLVIIVIDQRHRIIPDEMSLSLLALGLMLAWWNPRLGETPWIRILHSVGACAVGGGFMLGTAWLGEKWLKKEALGGGDIKLMAAFGALLGFPGLYAALFFGSLLGGVAGLTLVALKRQKWGQALPFGPYLVIGIWIGFFGGFNFP